MNHRVRLLALTLAGILMLAGGRVCAADRYALVVTGASGGAQYAEKYDEWRNAFVQLLQGPLGYKEDHVLLLAEEDFAGAKKATRENVRAAMADIRQHATKDDVVLVVLVGHGSGSDGGDAKFNLVGPDLTAREWAELVRPIPSRLVFINAASGSFPFLEQLSAQNRIVITANDSAAQTFETVMPPFLLAAYTDQAADLDKNGKTSIWEAFTFISAKVRGYFEQHAQLATEHPMIDDDGDGVGRLLDEQGPDGILARTTYLRSDAIAEDTTNPQRTTMLRRRAELEQQLEELRARKESMPLDDYEDAIEKVLLEIARLDKALRSRS